MNCYRFINRYDKLKRPKVEARSYGEAENFLRELCIDLILRYEDYRLFSIEKL